MTNERPLHERPAARPASVPANKPPQLKSKPGFSIASLVLFGLALVTFSSGISLAFAAVGLLLSIIAIVKGEAKGASITATVLCSVLLAATFVLIALMRQNEPQAVRELPPTSEELGLLDIAADDTQQDKVFKSTCNVLTLGGVEEGVSDLIESGRDAGHNHMGTVNSIREAATHMCPEHLVEVERVLSGVG